MRLQQCFLHDLERFRIIGFRELSDISSDRLHEDETSTDGSLSSSQLQDQKIRAGLRQTLSQVGKPVTSPWWSWFEQNS
jgi:hypothetical protein